MDQKSFAIVGDVYKRQGPTCASGACSCPQTTSPTSFRAARPIPWKARSSGRFACRACFQPYLSLIHISRATVCASSFAPPKCPDKSGTAKRPASSIATTAGSFAFEAVSYTHLDVYKRQAIRRPAGYPRTRPPGRRRWHYRGSVWAHRL